MTGGGIPLPLVEMGKDDVLDVEAGWVKGKDQVTSTSVLSGGK